MTISKQILDRFRKHWMNMGQQHSKTWVVVQLRKWHMISTDIQVVLAKLYPLISMCWIGVNQYTQFFPAVEEKYIWLVVWNIWIIFSFHIWDVILPIDFHIFQRGGSTTTRYDSLRCPRSQLRLTIGTKVGQWFRSNQIPEMVQQHNWWENHHFSWLNPL